MVYPREVSAVPLEDHVENPPKKASIVLRESQWTDLSAIARALGRDRQDVIAEMLEAQTKLWLAEATPAQVERYQRALAELVPTAEPQAVTKLKGPRASKK
jgi:hypothetical protein